MKKKIAALIPAAGKSERMGMQKALLTLNNGIGIAQHLIDRFNNFGCDPVVIVVNEQFDSPHVVVEKLVTVVNQELEKGRSWSIYLGLQKVPEETACFIQNTDNPFLEPGLLSELVAAVKPDGYAVPVFDMHGGHPLLLGSRMVDFIRRQQDPFDFRQALQQFKRFEVPWKDDRILLNLNTRRDFEDFISRYPE